MELIRFKNYLFQLEKEVLIPSVERKIFSKDRMVSIKTGKLETTSFGEIVGSFFNSNVPCAIDYYGLLKKSSSFIKAFVECDVVKIRTVKVPVVFFASLKIEHINDLNADLVRDFPLFKRQLLSFRGFGAPNQSSVEE